MPVPDYQSLVLPLLARLGKVAQPMPVRSFLSDIADEFELSQEERAERIPSGLENLLSNRLAWARTYLGKARLLASPTRDDGTPLNYTLVNIKDWCKNAFEVVSQLRINTNNSHHRYDVILLINGVPVVQIELKTLGMSTLPDRSSRLICRQPTRN